MAAKKKKAKPMTLAEKIQYGTSDTLELVSGWLGDTPDMPGGCETVARFSLGKSRRLISVDLLSELRDLAEASVDMLEALENLLWHAEKLEEFQESERGKGLSADQLYEAGEMHAYMVNAKDLIARAKGEA